jgi:hypothetical protein
MQAQLKKVPYIDERTGEYNLRFNMQNLTEDFYLPVRGGDSGTSIENLPGMEFTGIEDIDYLKNKMLAALRIPKAFLGFDEGVAKSSLAQEDVRFAKTINRIQRIVLSELQKIAIVHLYAQGFKDASMMNFELKLTNPSTIQEQEKIALWSDKINLAKDMTESKLFSTRWVYENIFNIFDVDVKQLRAEILDDIKRTYRYSQIEGEGNDPASSGQSISSSGGISDSSLDFDEKGDGEDGGDEGSEGGDEFGGDDMGGDEGGDDMDMGGDDSGGDIPDELTEEHHGNSDPEAEESQRLVDADRKRDELKKRGGVENPLGKHEKTGSKTEFNPLKQLRKPRMHSLMDNFEGQLVALDKKINTKTIIVEKIEKPKTSMLDENNIEE